MANTATSAGKRDTRTITFKNEEHMCRVIAIANQKGGVGKTTTCVNLGIGLIEKKRQGLGKSDIIYVKNFVVQELSPGVENTEEQDTASDVSTEVQKMFPNYNNMSYTDLNNINLIHQSGQEETQVPGTREQDKTDYGMVDMMDETEACMEIICSRILPWKKKMLFLENTGC